MEKIEMPARAVEPIRQPEIWSKRAMRHTLHIPFRYRLEGQEQWSVADVINISKTGLLFSSEQLLEINARLEITFQTSGTPMLHSSTRRAKIVRRVLSNWPETRPVFGAKFFH